MTEAREARDEAIDRVEEHASPTWLEMAVRAIRAVAKDKYYLTTDDVWTVLDNYDIEGPHEPRAMAPAMLRAQATGIIVATPDYTKSTRRESHARPKRVWRSLLFEPRLWA